MNSKCWVVVLPKYNSYGEVKGFQAVRLTQGYPQSLRDGELAFRLSINLPASVFKPLADVTITVPEQELIAPVVTVG